MPGTLPSQRELLTNLVHALSETHHDDGGNAAPAIPSAAERHSSPVVETWSSPQRKNLILTLHVVFPGMLLPALDLLDRNLVRRLTQRTAPPSDKDRRQGAPSPSRLQQDQAQGERPTAERQPVYTVRSVASTLPRRGAAGPATSTRVYLVHLGAWSCSCAGFAVDAYAATGSKGWAEAATGGHEDAVARAFKFGGLSTTGLDAHGAETMPCCKHLLACLLADEWGEQLAAHVEEKSCTKEELAGIIAGI